MAIVSFILVTIFRSADDKNEIDNEGDDNATLNEANEANKVIIPIVIIILDDYLMNLIFNYFSLKDLV